MGICQSKSKLNGDQGLKVMDDVFRTNNDSIAKKLQKVYDTIKRERPWDIRPVDKMYTTAKEKYMIELIKEGHDISDETIAHVVCRCYMYHGLNDGKYVCWFGFILTHKEFPYEHFECQSFHKLNKRLKCRYGGIYYPVDIISSPFGEWQPHETKCEPEIQEVYNMIKQKWPKQGYEDELHKYTLKHLIKMIENGEPLTEDMKKHVVEGCERDCHRVDDNYICYSGFLRRGKQLQLGSDLFCKGDVLRYVMNQKLYEHTGIWDIPDTELRYRKYKTAQQVNSENIGPFMTNVNNIYDRILYRDLISPKSAENIRLTWQEQYLIENLKAGEDIPNEVVSHVLDGCYTLGHLLTDNYACCRGYILKRDLFFSHDILKCRSNHVVSKDLNCYEGRIYHRCAEVPKGRITISPPRCGGYSKKRIIEFEENPRLPHRPASPPPDHLDNQPMQHPVAMNLRPNHLAANIGENNNERDDGAEREIVRNAAQNRHPNAAPPPDEINT